MVMTDPIADMLTRIRNANAALHETVNIPASRMKAAVLDILYKKVCKERRKRRKHFKSNFEIWFQ